MGIYLPFMSKIDVAIMNCCKYKLLMPKELSKNISNFSRAWLKFELNHLSTTVDIEINDKEAIMI